MTAIPLAPTMRPIPNTFIFSADQVRTAVDEHGDVWFCAKDVCEALDIAWKGVGGTLKTLPEHWKGVCSQQTPGGVQETTFISEPGLYRLIFRSNKPNATRFADWVCEEVLPAIRKQGFYGSVSATQQIQLSNLLLRLLQRLDSKDAFVHRLVLRRLRNVCNLLGERMPPVELIGRNRYQHDLEV